MDQYRCPDCTVLSDTFNGICSHRIEHHKNDYITYLRLLQSESNATLVQTKKQFSIIPARLESNQRILINDVKQSLIIVNDRKSEEREERGKRDCETQTVDEQFDNYCNALDKAENDGWKEEFYDLVSCIADGKVTKDNICFLLLLDLVKFYKSKSTTLVKYSEPVKLFWRIGWKLFKGKFLKFMSGFKNHGDLVLERCQKGMYNPDLARINFVVPSISILREFGNANGQIFNDTKPGILSKMIAKVAETNTGASYKICVDGKKINSCPNSKLGQVDLWGFEGPPTLKEKKEAEMNDIDLVMTIMPFVQDIDMSEARNIHELKENAGPDIIKVTQRMSVMTSELRKLAQKRSLARSRFMDKAGKKWINTKFARIISLLGTQMSKMKDCIGQLQATTAELLAVSSTANSTSHLFARQDVQDLGKQANLFCLSKEVGGNRPTCYLSQQTDEWQGAINDSTSSCSTLNTALGLNTRKKQQEFFKARSAVITSTVQDEPHTTVSNSRTNRGNAVKDMPEVLNAVATITSRFLPAYYPSLIFREEGFYEITVENRIMLVVSPDGSLREEVNSCAKMAVEIKCLFPDEKPFSATVHHGVSAKSVPQLLCRMVVLNVNQLLYVAYSKEYTTFHTVEFDKGLWEMLQSELKALHERFIKGLTPIGNWKSLSPIKEAVTEFIKNKCHLLCEVPSVVALPCEHPIDDVHYTGYFHEHVGPNITVPKLDNKDVSKILQNACEHMTTFYHLTKEKATEILVFMGSDLDRLSKGESFHAAPWAYALRGTKLSADVFRKMLMQVITTASQEGMFIPVSSFDGEWASVLVYDRNGEPLTQLQLAKQIFKTAQSKSKEEIIETLAQHRITNFPRTSAQAILSMKERVTDAKQPSTSLDKVFLDYLDNEVTMETLNDNLEAVEINDDMLDAMLGYTDNTNAETSNDVESDETSEESHTTIGQEGTKRDQAFKDMHEALKASIKLRRKSYWCELDHTDFKLKFESAEQINSSFILNELKVCLRAINPILKNNGVKNALSRSKWESCNLLSALFGDNSSIESKKKSNIPSCVPTLASIAMKGLQKMSKKTLNIMYSDVMWPEAIENWKKKSPFANDCMLSGIGTISWKTQPEYLDELNHPLFSVWDNLHLFTNGRTKCCSTGMPAAGIDRNAFLKVAQTEKENGTRLNLAMVEDLIDRQSAAHAKTTFSNKVEQEMIRNGDMSTANFVKLFRNWFEAEDDPGMSALERCQHRKALHDWLLDGVDFSSFPPYGSHIKDIPVKLYEGLLTNIERHLQLHACVPSYNVRAIGSLDGENFYSQFQDLDPKGSGVLNPDDIPQCIGTSVELLSTRLSTERPFYMCTSAKRVYNLHQLDKSGNSASSTSHTYKDVSQSKCDLQKITSIHPQNHVFDDSNRAEGWHKRKRGFVTDYDQAAHGPKRIRYFHQAHDEDILPHKRANCKLDD